MSATAETAPAARPHELLAHAIGTLAWRLLPERIGTGPLAELRRLNDTSQWTSPFWRLLLEVVPESLRNTTEAENAWALIVGGMARMARQGRPSHAHGAEIGKALAETGYAEPRLVRLLRAPTEGFAVELRATCTWLDNKGRPVDWTKLAEFVLGRAWPFGPFDAEKAARAIARSYFGALAHAANAPQQPEEDDA